MDILSLMLIAFFIEAVITALKPMWNPETQKLSMTEVASMLLGVAISIALKLNMLEFAGIALETADWVRYVFYVCTGIAIGRGPSFLWDLWQHIKIYYLVSEEQTEGEPDEGSEQNT